MKDSILKENEYIINLSQSVDLERLIELNENINSEQNLNNIKKNGFTIDKKEGYFFINKTKFFNNSNLTFIYGITKDYPEIIFKYRDILLKIKENKQIITSSKKSLIKYLYYDLIILLEISAYKHGLNINYEKEKLLIEKIVSKKLRFSNKIVKKSYKKYNQSKISQRSSNSKIWSRICFKNKLPTEIRLLGEKINPREIELPRDYDKEKVFNLLYKLNQTLDYLKIENRDFDLRFKKLGLYKKRGLYIKNAQCIIVDPRNANTIFHELGHFIHETNTTFYLDEKKITKRNRKKIIKENKLTFSSKIKNHNIEELDEESEIFAYWFEKMLLMVY